MPIVSRPFGAGHARHLVGTATGLMLALGSHAAAAQDATTGNTTKPPSRKATDEKVENLQGVDVYGTPTDLSSPKFTAPLVDTPRSVTVLPSSLITEAAATSLQDALRNVPGITFGAGEGGNPIGDRPSIRGFSSTASTYVDGMRDIAIQTRDVFDLEQIEVVRGPDSSIAGRSAGGGSINLVSKTARENNFADISETYGSASQHRTTLDANYRFTPGVAGRVNIMDMGGGVPGRDSAVRSDKFGFAPTITFGMGSPNRLTLGYYHLEDKGTPDYGVPVDLETGKPYSEVDPAIGRKTFYGLKDRDFRRATVNAVSASLDNTLSDSFNLRTQVRATRSVNNYSVTSPDDAAGNTTNGYVYRLPIGRRAEDNSVIAQSDLFGRFDTGTLHHDMDVGVELSQERLRQAGDGNYNGYLYSSPAGPQGFGFENCYLPGEPENAALLASHDCTTLHGPNPHDAWDGSVVPNPVNSYYTTKNAAAYAFDTVTLSSRWKLNGGVRWDGYHTRSHTPGVPENSAADHLTFFSYQASVMFKPVENGTLYLTGSNASLPIDLAFGDQDQATPATSFSPATTGRSPMKTTTVEAGVKWNLLANRLLVSGDVFTEERKNAPIEVIPGTFDQSGKTRSRGVELSANGMITPAWNVIAGYSHINGELRDGAYYDNAVDKQLVDTPKNTFSLWSTYQVTPAISVGGGAYYRDEQVGYYGPPDRIIPSYWRVDALGSWQVNTHLRLQLNLQNLLDRKYYTKSYYQFALPAAGRTWMLTANLHI